jgi:yeast amino acid transporter
MDLNQSGSAVFNWFINIGNTSGFMLWVCCGTICIRFRKACAAQGIPIKSLPYSSWTQPWGSYVVIVVFSILTIINGFTVFLPGQWSASSFLTAYIGVPTFLLFYLGHRFYHWKDPWFRPSGEVDLQTGVAEVLEEQERSVVPEKTLKGRLISIATIGFL